jgi:hypothetical protein
MSEEKTEPKKDNTVRNVIIVIVLIIGAVWLYNSLSSAVNEAERQIRQELEPEPEPDSYTVRYRIGGTASEADITIENASGGTEQKTVDVPWSETFEAELGQFVYVSAQSQDDADRTINCEIQVNGTVLESAESRGQYVIASCSGSVGR